MGKAVAYVVLTIIGVLLLRSTGLLDGMFSRGNLDDRDAFWRATVAAEVSPGTSKADVQALASRHGVVLECFTTSLQPRVETCRGDDPISKGGTAGRPVALNLHFTFHADAFAEFETSRRMLR